jgi:deoxyribodipyrimidine photo-lyase
VIEEVVLSAKRPERYAQMRTLFPEVQGEDCVFEGGRAAGLKALHRVDAAAYERTRNYLDGNVSRLSPYLRHGMIALVEAASFAYTRFNRASYKFIFELAWRDFWRISQYKLGEKIEGSVEDSKVPIGNAALSKDIKVGETGLSCMDQFVRDLRETGYVHNHARMWFASYVVHHRKIDWKAAADWYYGELLDGDRASNHLSWQWVASTFSHKPYIFNRENLERYTRGRFCAQCEARNRCPFDMSYEALEQKLFGTTRERV